MCSYASLNFILNITNKISIPIEQKSKLRNNSMELRNQIIHKILELLMNSYFELLRKLWIYNFHQQSFVT